MKLGWSIRRYLEALPPRSVVMVAAGLVALVAAIDLVTGPLISLSFFYVLPLAIVAWRLDRSAAVTASLVAGLIWLSIDLLTGEPRPLGIPLWNALIRTAFFVTISWLLVDLRAALAHETQLARVDPLTGLANRRAFEDVVARELARSERSYEPITIAVLDVDDFKRINDTAGHARGDAALTAVAEELASHVRGADLAARLGGDEFGLMLVGDGAANPSMLKRLCARITALEITGFRLSCSVGAVTVAGGTIEAALEGADRALYQAKRAGKGRIEVQCLTGLSGEESDRARR
jgi:diguanylate cyclase (GGDEF)-like protein